jgi:hypothetical protein
MGYADPLYRSAAFQVSQRAPASDISVHMGIISVKHKMRLPTTASSAGFPRLHIPLLVEVGAGGYDLSPAQRAAMLGG